MNKLREELIELEKELETRNMLIETLICRIEQLEKLEQELTIKDKTEGKKCQLVK